MKKLVKRYAFQDFEYSISNTFNTSTFTFASTDYDEVIGIDSIKVIGTPVVHE